MRIQSCIAAASALALAACGGPDKADGNGTAASSSAAAGGQVQLDPGEWEMTMETLNVDAPGMPPAFAAAMKSAPKTHRTCMTAEEAKGPKGDIFAGQPNANCKQTGFTWAGGRIQGTTTCTGANGAGKMEMKIDGQYGRQSMDVKMNMRTEAQGTAMTIESRMTGRRIGDCPAGQGG